VRGAWYVVEVFCALCIVRALLYIKALGDVPTLLALVFASLLLVFALTAWTLSGIRWARRTLAAYILANTAYVLWSAFANGPHWGWPLEGLLLLYLTAGAVQLWRLEPAPAPGAPPPAPGATLAKAWYVVEAYCATILTMSLLWLRAFISEPKLGSFLLWIITTTLFLAMLTFRGNRLASRALAFGIALSAGIYVLEIFRDIHQFSIYMAYGLLVCGYFLIGAIKLWCIKELPTRFTDPPTHA
jgi:hypothetical protein